MRLKAPAAPPAWALGAGLAGLALVAPLALAGQARAVTPAAPLALPVIEQWVLVAGVYLLKPIYMALAAAGVVRVWGQTSHPLSALRWALIAFLAGELFCWVNILVFVEEDLTLELLHSWGMVVCVALLAYAGLELVDEQLLHYSDPRARCALAGVCQGCAKAGAGPCRLRRLFLWTVPALGVLTGLPLTAAPADITYLTRVFGFGRVLTHALPVQLYEIRAAPLAALGLFVLAWVWLWRRGQTAGGLRTAKILLAAGLGHLGFSYLRLALAGFYGVHLAWFVFWEEATELLLIGLVWVGLSVLAPGPHRSPQK